jgi:hypothetical protein
VARGGGAEERGARTVIIERAARLPPLRHRRAAPRPTRSSGKLGFINPLTFGPFSDRFGTDVELISYPHGMAYETTASIPLWNPRDNHP